MHMTQVNKMLQQLKKIQGSTKQVLPLDVARQEDEQVCKYAQAGNKDFQQELLRRAEIQEIEGDYVMATEFYKCFIKSADL